MKKDKEIWLDPEEIQQLLEGGLYWIDVESKISPENANSIKKQLNMDQDFDIEGISKPTLVIGQPDDEEKDVRAILLGQDKLQARRAELSAQGFDPIIKNRQIDISNVEERLHSSFMPEAAATEEDFQEIKAQEELFLGKGQEESFIDKEQEELFIDEEQSEEKVAFSDRDGSEENLLKERLFAVDSEEEKEVGLDERSCFSHFDDDEDTLDISIPSHQVDNELKDFILSNELEPEEEEQASFGGLKLIILLAVVAALTFGFWYYFLSM